MATGRSIQLTKQVGEYLVAAELCRRDWIATTFSGNVPAYDIVASNEKGKSVLIQVKTIKSNSWQLNIQAFAEFVIRNKKQIFKKLKPTPTRNLICVFVQLSPDGRDKFYIFSWTRLQSLLVSGYRKYLAEHGGRRPKKFDSFHCALDPSKIQHYKDNWELIEKRLRGF